MEIQPKITSRAFAAIVAIFGWFAVVMQFYLILLNRTEPVGETIVRFFSFFTILTNIIAAITLTVVFVNLDTGVCRFCRRANTISAVTVYIIMVGAIYNVILRSQWKPEGLQRIVDELLHSVIPALYLIFWILFVPKKQLEWKNSIPWLIYPLVYTVFIVIRGSLTGYYPYSFIHAGKLGYPRAFLNGAWMLLFFLAISLLLILVAKLISRNSRREKINTSPLYSNE